MSEVELAQKIFYSINATIEAADNIQLIAELIRKDRELQQQKNKLKPGCA